MSKKRKLYLRKIDLILLGIIVIIIAKVIRWTLLKKSFVESAIGNYMVYYLLYGFSGRGDSFYIEANDANMLAVKMFGFLHTIFGIRSYAGFEIAISIIFNCIVLLLFLKMKHRFTIFESVFLLFSLASLNMFAFCLSKEPVQMLFFIGIFIVLIFSSLKISTRYLWALAVVFVSGFMFRSYYFFMVIFVILYGVIFPFLERTDQSRRKGGTICYLATPFLISVIFYLLMLLVAKAFFPSVYAEVVRVRTRILLDVNTAISILFTYNTPFGVMLNYMSTFIRMLFPLELILKGVYYIPYIPYQLLLTYILIRATLDFRSLHGIARLALYMQWGFVACSAMFETDFGSWLRHETVTFILYAIIIGVYEQKPIRAG